MRHELGRIHVYSFDSPNTKVYCQSERHFGCRISTPTSHRSLFFLSHQQMLDGVHFLLQAQNFASRTSQYTKVKQLFSANPNAESWLVRH